MKQNINIAKLNIEYYCEDNEDFSVLIVQGKHFEKTFYGDEAKNLFIKLIGGHTKNEVE